MYTDDRNDKRGSEMTKDEESNKNNRLGKYEEVESVPPGDLLPAQRRDLILGLLLRDDVVRVKKLAAMMHTTEITIRRDLSILDHSGLLKRVRGGAISLNLAGKQTEQSRDHVDMSIQQAPEPDDFSPLTSVTMEQPAIIGEKSQGTVAVVLPEPSLFWPGVTEYIRRIAHDEYQISVISRETSYEDYPETGILDSLTEITDLRGFIIAPGVEPTVAHETWTWLRQNPLPTVVIERDPPLMENFFMNSVQTNHRNGVRKAILHFMHHGHHRIGAALSFSPTSMQIEDGWHHMMAASDQLEETFTFTNIQAYDTNQINSIIDRIIATRTTAVLVHTDYLSVALAQALERRGKTIPADISLISIDGFTTPSTRPLTVLRSSESTLGGSAIHLLMDLIADRDRPTEHILVDPTLIDRGSVADLADGDLARKMTNR